MRNYEYEVPVSKKNYSIVKDDSKCITCGQCKKICANEITVAKMFEVNPNNEPICINCGQCTNICPTEALHEKYDYTKVKKILHNKKDNIVVFSIAPTVSVSIVEEFGLTPGINLEQKLPTALKSLGADYVFNTSVGTNLTIMEEATELVERIKNKDLRPLFTSHCPAWVKYCEIFYPELIENISTTKSPITNQSTIIKTYFKQKIKKDKIINIVVTSCTATKTEIHRKKINVTSLDTNYSLTTRELSLLFKEENINLINCKNSTYDSQINTDSNNEIIYGKTGSLCKSVISVAYYLLTNTNLPKEEILFTPSKEIPGIQELTINIKNQNVKIAICNGIKNAKDLIDKLINKEVYFDFIEIMNCKDGCINGGGQPKITLLNMKNTKTARMNTLNQKEENTKFKYCYEDSKIKDIYKEYLEYPNSKISNQLLHTKYCDKSYLLKGEEHE